MTTQIDFERRYTFEEFLDLPDNGRQYELINGELIEMRGPSIVHGKIILKLGAFLDNYLAQNPVGQAFSGTAFVFTPKTAPIPDVAFVLTDRLGSDKFDAFPGPPDLAVEVLSRTDMVFNVDEKIETYLQVGVKLVWVINPRSEIVFVYRPASGLLPQCVNANGELDGEDLLPGLKIKVSELFK